MASTSSSSAARRSSFPAAPARPSIRRQSSERRHAGSCGGPCCGRMMINITYLGLGVIAFVALFKLGLILAWTKRLHDRHGARYEFSQIFRMMFGPRTPFDVGPAFWKDLEPIQKWN